ncbi:hypothetical protein SELMODRAFT_424998 [Selaginella moellendorffii]|uniref:FBD domain-containing protein n=1 Tax=Selaginella moellendorffii TaxID=88036 RepID=D8SRP6_SELML|nr:hypothetical protein SELMODRAFT_424998 [Selaginella moellendorffii]
MGRCCKHKAELDECDCVQTSVSMVTSRLQKITSFCLCSTSLKVDCLNWTKLLGSSLLGLEIGWNVTLQRISTECINLQELRIDGLGSQERILGKLQRQDQALNRFLRQCPNLKHIYLKLHDDYGNPDINDDVNGFYFETPPNTGKYALELEISSRFSCIVSAPRLEKLIVSPSEVDGGGKVTLVSAESLEKVVAKPDDFGFGHDSVDFYELFLLRFNMVDEYQELELGLGFLAKLEFDYAEDEILGQCLLRIHRLFVSESPEEEELDLRPDLGRAAHAVEKVINLCRVQHVTLVTSDRAVERSFDPASSFDMESLVEFYKQH